jgi:hypothetical protein
MQSESTRIGTPTPAAFRWPLTTCNIITENFGPKVLQIVDFSDQPSNFKFIWQKLELINHVASSSLRLSRRAEIKSSRRQWSPCTCAQRRTVLALVLSALSQTS